MREIFRKKEQQMQSRRHRKVGHRMNKGKQNQSGVMISQIFIINGKLWGSSEVGRHFVGELNSEL